MGRAFCRGRAARFLSPLLLLLLSACRFAAALEVSDAANILLLESDLNLETPEGLQARAAS